MIKLLFQVKVSSDYTMINVYWTSNKIWDEERIKKSLVKAGMELRVELTSLRVVGNVPHIQFVRDRTYSAWTAVEDRLRTCDFGENYIPSGVNNFKLDFNNDILPPPQAQTQADVRLQYYLLFTYHRYIKFCCRYSPT